MIIVRAEVPNVLGGRKKRNDFLVLFYEIQWAL